MTAPLPKEALDFFKNKKLKPAFHYQDVWREEHAWSFTVAKAMKLDILQDIQGELEKVLSEGNTFADFKKELMPRLQKKGWWGIREVIDPETGEVDLVQLGSPRRLQIIYDANIRSARAAGQWERIQRVKKAMPYLVYELGPSVEHRKQHLEWAGIILPVDHPFWLTHFAPNGWGCKCRIRQISQRTYDKLVATGEYKTKTVPPIKVKYKTSAPKITYKKFKNGRTGIIEDVPVGIDPGWNTNPGYLRQISLDRDYVAKALKLESLTRKEVNDLFVSPVRLAEFKAWVTKAHKNKHSIRSVRTAGVVSDLEINFLTEKKINLKEILIILEDRLMVGRKAVRHTDAGNQLSPSQWQKLPELLNKPETVLWHKRTTNLIYLHQAKDGRFIKTSIKINDNTKSARKAGLAERLNAVVSTFLVEPQDKKSMMNDPEYEIIKE